MKVNVKTKFEIACGQEIDIEAEVALQWSGDTDTRYITNMELSVDGAPLTDIGREAITDEDWADMHQHVIDESTDE